MCTKYFQRDPVILASSFGNYLYHIAIYTGHRFGSGTTATPSLIISGKFGDSPPLRLTTDQRRLFERGSVDTFLYATDFVSFTLLFFFKFFLLIFVIVSL